MKMSNNGIAMLKSFEGCKLMAYQDPTGIWTIGYGWTQPINHVPIGQGMIITQSTAESLLLSGLVRYEKGITDLVTVPINQNQFDALVDFAWNLGIKSLACSSLLRKLNDGSYTKAADEFLKWNKAGGKVMPGLVKRRTTERSLFLS